jgi:hypothetical protein
MHEPAAEVTRHHFAAAESSSECASHDGDVLEDRAAPRTLPVVSGGDGSPESTHRRDVVRLLAAAPLAAFAVTLEAVERAASFASDALQQAAQRGRPFAPKFFARDEFQLVRTLADLVIPKDERSGSATDAGVPEFMDFIMTAYPDMQKPMRDGLKWLNDASMASHRQAFVAATPAQQIATLDRIAFPKMAAAADKPGVDFFNRFRDLTASGFWSSRIGHADLQYMGNRALTSWNGCPPSALAKLGVRYS